MIKGLVFDLDGTLIDLPVDWEALFDTLKQIMNVENVRPLSVTIPRTEPKIRREIFKAWDQAELAAAKKLTLNAKGMKVYTDNRNKPKALVTMQGTKAVNLILDYIKIGFESTITREDSLSREEQLVMAANRLKIPLGDILFVGDTDSDAAAAKKVGCQFRKVN